MTADANTGDTVRVSIEGQIAAVFETGYLLNVDGVTLAITKSQVTSIVERAEERRNRRVNAKKSEKRI